MINNGKIFRVVLLLMTIIFATCSPKKEADSEDGEDKAESSTEVWVEMDEFHQVMADCYHPFKDSANLIPARNYAGAMAAAAEKWLTSPLPPSVDKDQIKENLQLLKRQADEFATVAKTDDDVAVGESLSALHDTFHSLQEAWYESKSDDEQTH
jgi:hypothetical protein